MIKTLLTLTCLTFSIISFGQNTTDRKMTPIVPLTNIERYGVDYVLKDYTFNSADSTLINSIDLQSLEPLREQNQNTEVTDPVTGLVVILFFKKKTRTTNPSNNQEL